MRFSRTKLLAAGVAILQTLQSANVIHIPPETFQTILVLLGSGSLWTLRDAIAKNGSGE